MHIYQLRQIYEDTIEPKYKEFKIPKDKIFIGADYGVPCSSGICYDKEEQMWVKYAYDDYSRHIWGYYHTEEEACDNFYEELMEPIISEQKWLTVVEPTEEDKEKMKKMKPYKGDDIEEKLLQLVSKDRCLIFLYQGKNTILEIPAYIRNAPVEEIRGLKKDIISVKLPKTMKYLKERCFFKDYLSDISLNNGLKLIGDYAFSMCWNLKSIKLPDTLEELGVSAFAGSGLQEITIPKKIKTLNRTFYKTKLVHVKVPANVTRLENQAFDEIETLQDVFLEEGVEYIGESVFCTNPNLHMIYIPRSVTYISELNFLSCAEDFQIVTPQGSYAEQYAKENNLTVVNA